MFLTTINIEETSLGRKVFAGELKLDINYWGLSKLSHPLGFIGHVD